MVAITATFALLAAAAFAASWSTQRRLRETSVELERVRARERRSSEHMRLLLDASRRSSDDVFGTLAAELARVEPAADAVLAFVPDGNDLRCRFASGARVEHYGRTAIARDDDRLLAARAAQAGHRASGTGGLLVPTDRRAIAVPMTTSAGLHAVVYASTRGDEALDDDAVVRCIEQAASPFALALEREAKLAEATYDGLTGLLTPRAFREALREEFVRARFQPSPVLTLWFIDTDHFKSVNDTLGHAAGDAVLHAMAELLRASLDGERDVAARNGGDEFCALIHDAQKSVAIERAHAFCEAVRRHDFGASIRLTASVGVASHPYDARDANELLELADAAMYHSKRCGRDRVSFALSGTSFAVFREPSTESAVLNL
jgi:diguanylate cyclase (GGDEF)-like protein